jgi:hypothetical protein
MHNMFALWPGDRLNFSIFIYTKFVHVGEHAVSIAATSQTQTLCATKPWTDSTMLKNKVKEIINWCEKNDIIIFYGSTDQENSYPQIYWDSEVDNGHIKFLETAKKLDI